MVELVWVKRNLPWLVVRHTRQVEWRGNSPSEKPFSNFVQYGSSDSSSVLSHPMGEQRLSRKPERKMHEGSHINIWIIVGHSKQRQASSRGWT